MKLPTQPILDAFGGMAALAKALGHKNITTVQGWKESGTIPSWRRHEIEQAAERENVSVSKVLRQVDSREQPEERGAA